MENIEADQDSIRLEPREEEGKTAHKKRIAVSRISQILGVASALSSSPGRRKSAEAEAEKANRFHVFREFLSNYLREIYGEDT